MQSCMTDFYWGCLQLLRSNETVVPRLLTFMGCRLCPGAVCQPAALSLRAGRVDSGDDGVGVHGTGTTLCNWYQSPFKARKMHNPRPPLATFANVLLVACGIFKSVRCVTGVTLTASGVAQSGPPSSLALLTVIVNFLWGERLGAQTVVYSGMYNGLLTFQMK